jgi:hypothetical protein
MHNGSFCRSSGTMNFIINKLHGDRHPPEGERKLLLVCDGVLFGELESMINALFRWQEIDEKNRRILLVSSMCSEPNFGNDNTRFQHSWTNQEFACALAHTDLSTKFANLEPGCNLKTKVLLSGGNARYFFEKNREDVKLLILKDLIALLEELGIVNENDYVPEHFHSLINVYSNKKIDWLNEWAKAEFIRMAEPKRIRRMYPLMRKNMVSHVKGWWFENCFYAELQSGQLQLTGDSSSEPIRWTNENPLETFDTVNTFEPRESTWYRPKRENQAGFDGFYIGKQGFIRFIQLTLARMHDLKLLPMQDVIKSCIKWDFPIDTVEVCFIIPNSEAKISHVDNEYALK